MIWARVSIAHGFDLGDFAKPVVPVAVSFAPSKAPADWSVSVTVEDVGEPVAPRARNAGRSFRRSAPVGGIDLASLRMCARGVAASERVLLQPETAHQRVRFDLHDLQGADLTKRAGWSGRPVLRPFEGGEPLLESRHPVRNGSQFAPPLDAIQGSENVGDDRHG